MIPRLLASRFAGIAGAGLSVILAVLLAITYFNGKGLERALDKSAGRIIALTGQRDTARRISLTLEQALRGSNAAIDRLKTEAELAAAKSRLAQEQAQREAAIYRARAAELAKARPGADKCASAAALIDATISGERK